jgi:DNA polymerase elongation subunit (family B)
MYLEGLESLDLMRLYQKFVFESVPTHRLDYIASRELGEGKLEFTGTHSQFRASDPQKYVDYCIKDAELVLKTNDKRKLLQLACTVAWLAKMNISDVYSPVKTWDAILCNDMKADNVYPTIVADIPESKTFLGAFVKEPKPDIYDWVLSFDVTSLYPSLIMQFNMCASSMVLPSESIHLHEKMLDGYKLELEENLFTAANSVRFDGTKKAYMAEAAKRLFTDRVKAKAKMLELQKIGDNIGASQYKTLQEAIKVTLNSLYGACGNRWFRFYDIRIAEAITASGQYAIRKIEQNLNDYMGYDCVIAMDTDSVYVNCGKDHTLDSIKVLEIELDKKIKEWCSEITQSFGCTESYIHLKRESIAKRGLWTGKKRYALDLLDVEGVSKSEIKTVGLETAKGSSAIITKKIMNEALELVMRGTDRNRIADKLDTWYDDFVKCDLVAMAEIMKVGDMAKEKGMHINARAAKALNDYYGRQVIQEDEKALIFYLNEPNIYDTNVVAVPLDADEHILKEVNRYVDYKKMYDKLVEKVVGRLADAANIPMVRELENLF